MIKKFSLFLGLIAVLAVISSAQNNQNQSGPNTQNQGNAVRLDNLAAELLRYSDDCDDAESGPTRPRVVAEKSSAVKASVIINAAAAERRAFDAINQKRAEHGLQPLSWSNQLVAVARVHSQNMAEYNFFSHVGLDGKRVSDRADDAGLGKWRAIGENIAFNQGFQDPVGKAIEGWMNSPGHMHNLLDENWKESAIGVAVGKNGSYYFTQVFLARK